ncbi:HD domain-containing phosphohydrolase [Roseospira navarrensis]|uniref:PAS domain-containing protein n=1 Tax=Roseospira navarrensis TaxID=140058 RepID=A0A7X1ZBM8_9PROT|nr:HD domain-containing phosphohydrolase [Roseospira navarrensis]MQX35561.1 PAS domain-containing protein [Roseospira navarrensis]
MTASVLPSDSGFVRQERTVRKRVWIALAGLVLFLAAGLGLVALFAQSERQRDLMIAQSQMTVVADSRVEAVRGWMEARTSVLQDLADNQALQIYTTVVRLGPESGQSPDEVAAQETYLTTLLTATAERGGFAPAEPTRPLPANVNRPTSAGLALVTPDGGRIIAATQGMPTVRDRVMETLATIPEGEPGLIDLAHNPHGTLTLGFVAPVFGQTPGSESPTVIARLVGLRPVGAAFFEALDQPGATAETAESYLIRRQGNAIQYLTPLLDGSDPLDKTLAVNTDRLIDAEALRDPGRFHQGLDYAARESLAVSRAIPGTDWVLVHRLARAEALAAADARRTTLIVVLVLVIGLMAAALVAVWRYGTSLRAQEAATQFRAAAQRFEALSQFLDVVADSQPSPLFVATADNTLVFANRRAGEVMDMPKADLPGRSMIAMLGHDIGSAFADINGAVMEDREVRTETTTFRDDDGQEVVWWSYHCPITVGDDRTPAVLTSIDDLTPVYRERTRREANTIQLIETLVGLVDERDPDSAHQSRYVAAVARTIAEELGLDATLIEASDQAARLVNLGKIRVQRGLLRKQGDLTEAEREQLRLAMESGPEILKDIAFEAPVLETLRQINERVDGKGRPNGLEGSDILASAQCVAVANTFVALISPRAFRESRSFEEAEDILLSEVGTRFDRRPVLCLLNYLSNKGGRDQWAFMAQARSG